MKLKLLPPTPITPIEWIERLNDHVAEIDATQEAAVNDPSETNFTILAQIGPKTHKLLQRFYRIANVGDWEQQAIWDSDSFEAVAFKCASWVDEKMYRLRDFWSAVRIDVIPDIKLEDASQWWALQAWAEDIGEPLEEREAARKDPDDAGVFEADWKFCWGQ